MTVYMFMPDNMGAPTCTADCAQAWPPLLVDDGAEATAGEGLDAALLATATHPEAGTQVTYNGWPLYYFAGDSAPGDTNGQGQGDVWYVIDAAAGTRSTTTDRHARFPRTARACSTRREAAELTTGRVRLGPAPAVVRSDAVRSPKDFFKPLAVGAPAPLREIPVKPSRMIHFFPASNAKLRGKVPDMVGTVDVLLANLEDGVPADDKAAGPGRAGGGGADRRVRVDTSSGPGSTASIRRGVSTTSPPPCSRRATRST